MTLDREIWVVLVVIRALERLVMRGRLSGFKFDLDDEDEETLAHGLALGLSPTRGEVAAVMEELGPRSRSKKERTYLVAVVREEITPGTVGAALCKRLALALGKARR